MFCDGEVFTIAEIGAVLLIIAFGAIGYLIATFEMQPILHYRGIKYRIAADLVFYANVIDLIDPGGQPTEENEKRKKANRRCAGELKAIYGELPYWYRWWIWTREEDPMEAYAELIGLSNVSDRNQAKDYIQGVKKYLCLGLE